MSSIYHCSNIKPLFIIIICQHNDGWIDSRRCYKLLERFCLRLLTPPLFLANHYSARGLFFEGTPAVGTFPQCQVVNLKNIHATQTLYGQHHSLLALSLLQTWLLPIFSCSTMSFLDYGKSRCNLFIFHIFELSFVFRRDSECTIKGWNIKSVCTTEKFRRRQGWLLKLFCLLHFYAFLGEILHIYLLPLTWFPCHHCCSASKKKNPLLNFPRFAL